TISSTREALRLRARSGTHKEDCCEPALLVPALVEAYIDGDVADDIALLCRDVLHVGDTGQLRLLLLQLYRKPAPGCVVGVVDGVIQGIAYRLAAFQVREGS